MNGKRRQGIGIGEFLLLVIVTAFMGCAVGPDFRSPTRPTVKTYTAAALPEKTVATSGKDGVSQKFISGRDIPREWWKLFHSAALDRLLRQALDNSPTLCPGQSPACAKHRKTAIFSSATCFPSC